MTADELRDICTQHGIVVNISGFVREADAAALLDHAVRTLRQWRTDGDGPPAVRVGGSWRYSLDVLAAALTPPAESGKIRQNSADCDIDTSRAAADDVAHVPTRMTR